MKIAAGRADDFARRPHPKTRAVLVYGPDAGLARERADALAASVVDDPADPFRVAEVTPAQLKDDPARLADEVAAIAFTGGRRVVRLRGAGDGQTAVIAACLGAAPGDALLVVEAGELAARSSLRKLFEGAGDAAALACYRDEGGGLRRVIEETLAPLGFSLAPDAEAYLETVLGGDRLATRAELAKLAAYMGGERRVGLADVEACVGDSALVTLDGVAIAAASGDLAAVERGLVRAFLEGAQPVGALRAAARHLQRLHRLAGAVAAGKSADQAIRGFRPPLHFRVADALRGQLGRWPAARVARAMDIVLTAERDCKTTGLPAEAICGRALMQIAQAARAARR